MFDGWRKWLWWFIGASLIVSGTANMFGLGEDIRALFATMAAANDGTRLGPLSDLIAANARPVIVAVSLFMMTTGVAELFDWPGRRFAAIGQVVMLLAFISLLHRAYPEVIFADGLYLAALAALLNEPRTDQRRAGA